MDIAHLEIFALFVAPVRGDTFLGDTVHFVGANLNFDALPVGSDHAGVERLIHVDLGQGDIILESPRHRTPLSMNHAQRFVTFALSIDQDTKRDQIIDLVVEQILALHLLVNAIKVLGPAGHLGFDPLHVEFLGDDRDDLFSVFFPVGLLLRDIALQLIVDLRVQILERQVLQLALDPGDAEPVRQRRVDIQGLLRREELLIRRHMIQGPHVMHAVGKLDQDNAHVFAHREQHLAKVLGLLFFPAAEIGSAQFRHPVDERRNLPAKKALKFIERRQCIFDRIVQQSAGDAGHVELQVGNDIGNRQRVYQIGLARKPFLSLVNLRGKIISFAQKLDVRRGIIGLDLFD